MDRSTNDEKNRRKALFITTAALGLEGLVLSEAKRQDKVNRAFRAGSVLEILETTGWLVGFL